MIASPDRDNAIRTVESISRWGYEVAWTGDHVAFTGPISDPLLQLTYLSALNPKLIFGTSVYLLPLRHPTPVAKMVATVDRLMGAGHFIFGVGVGGEFAREYEACGSADQGTRRPRDRSHPGDQASMDRAARRASRQIFQLRRNQHAARVPPPPAARRSGSAAAPKARSSAPPDSATAGCPTWSPPSATPTASIS